MEREKRKRRWQLEYKLASVCIAILFLVTLAATSLIRGNEVKSMEVNNNRERPVSLIEKEEIKGNIDDENSPKQEVKREIKTQDDSVESSSVSDTAIQTEKKQDETIKQSNNHIIYLTFDDGPNQYTDAILDLLGRYNAKATFFMLEPNMERYADSIRRMVNEGHSIGMHGVTHNAKIIYQSSEAVVNEMKRGQATLASISGLNSYLIRVPYGSVPHMKPAYFEAVNREGFKLWDWTIDSKDWKFLSRKYVSYILEQLESYSNPDEPKVVLMHDKASTVEHLESLLQKLTELGYEMKPLTEQLEPVTL